MKFLKPTFTDNCITNRYNLWAEEIHQERNTDHKKYAYLHLKSFLTVNFKSILLKFHTNTLYTADRRAHNENRPANCTLCNSIEPQNIFHLLINCEKTNEFRLFLYQNLEVDYEIDDYNLFFGYTRNMGEKGTYCNLILSLTVIFIWKQRENRNSNIALYKLFMKIWIACIVKTSKTLTEIHENYQDIWEH